VAKVQGIFLIFGYLKGYLAQRSGLGFPRALKETGDFDLAE